MTAGHNLDPWQSSGELSSLSHPTASHLPDLHLPELHDPAGESPPAPGQQRVPSVLQKLQKWGDYPAYGEPVQPTLFIPCKTPLSTTIHQHWTLPTPPMHSLTVPQLLAEQASQQHPVGLILDLSNHETLYEEDIPAGLEYEHIMLQSKVFPHPAAINEVVRAASSFWRRQPSQYIAIHCAYGFNRTGFVVCSYLIQACGMSVDAALTAFKASRPPGVKHEQFVAELHSRYPAASSRHQPNTKDANSPDHVLQTATELQSANDSQNLSGREQLEQRMDCAGSSESTSSEAAALHNRSLIAGSNLHSPGQHQASRQPHTCSHQRSSQPVTGLLAHGQKLQNGFRLNQQHAKGACGSGPAPTAPVSSIFNGTSDGVADALFTQPSQGAENDSLGLDQRTIMQELAASRLKNRSQRRLETLPSEDPDS